MVWMLMLACTPAEADEVAAVMLATGATQVDSGGSRVPATVGLPLERSDTLVTGSDGTIIVHLRNDHLVRIDADLELKVSDLVMIDAPKSTVEPRVQLETLLYADEAKALAPLVSTARERVAGWHSRLTAADSHVGLERAEGQNEMAEEAKEVGPDNALEPGGGLGLSGDVVPQPDAKKEERRRKTRPKPRPAPRPAPKGAGTSAGEGGAPPTPPRFGMRGPDEADSESAPQLRGGESIDIIEGWFATDGPHHPCLANWAATLGVELASIEIVLRIEDGTVVRTLANGGLRLPDCARSVLEGQQITDAEDGHTFTVELR